jgi:hypothetical protein
MDAKNVSGSWSFHAVNWRDNCGSPGGSIGDENALFANTGFTHNLFVVNLSIIRSKRGFS